jgi:hypothetical protein
MCNAYAKIRCVSMREERKCLLLPEARERNGILKTIHNFKELIFSKKFLI